jgi:hypothetical protein
MLAVVGGEHQREPAVHAEADNTGLAGAVISCGKPRAGRVSIRQGMRRKPRDTWPSTRGRSRDCEERASKRFGGQAAYPDEA